MAIRCTLHACNGTSTVFERDFPELTLTRHERDDALILRRPLVG